MSMYQTAATDLAALVSTAAGTTLTASDLTFYIPTPTMVGESDKNTKIWVGCNSSAALQGRVVVYYDRLDLSGLDHFDYIPQAMDVGASVYDVLDYVRDTIGITFTTDDLEETFVVDNAGVISVLLQAKAGSLGFIGQHTLAATTYPHISTAFSSNLLPGF